jgi:TonB family protein
MRKTGFLLALLIVAAGTAWAQQELAPTTDQGPTPVQPFPPTPDKNGVYLLSPEIAPPVLVNAVPAEYPPDASEADLPHASILAVVVGIDGVPTSVHPVNPNGSPFEASAIAAVQQSRFQPGTLDGKPVPVLVHVRVPFFHLAAAVPRLLLRYGQNRGLQSQRPLDALALQPGDTPPKALHIAEPEYSDKARRQKISGVVIVSVLVTAEGEPTDIRVEKSLGYGLDEEAIAAALKYQFKPGMRDGNPVPMRIHIEMDFKLY